MGQSAPMLLGAALALLALVMPAVVLNRTDQPRAPAAAVRLAGAFEFPPPPPPPPPKQPPRRAPVYTDRPLPKPVEGAQPNVASRQPPTTARAAPSDPAAPTAATPPRPPGSPPTLFEPQASAPSAATRDPRFLAIVDAVEKSPPTTALVMIADFRGTSRDAHLVRQLESELDKLVDRALDRLWWTRIADLFKQRDEALRLAAGLRNEYARATTPAQRQSIQDELRRLNERVRAATDELREMNYTLPAPPDPNNVQPAMRQQRDGIKYATWQLGVLRSVTRTRGVAPWEGR